MVVVWGNGVVDILGVDAGVVGASVTQDKVIEIIGNRAELIAGGIGDVVKIRGA